jgi:pyridoxine 5-phosphate synthase
MLCGETAELARAGGLVVNAGHALNMRNLPPFLSPIPFLVEASIGQHITVDALPTGLGPARAILCSRPRWRVGAIVA